MNRQKTMQDGFTVTDDGRIFTPKGREAKQRHNRKGYCVISVPDERCGRTTRLVHRLVAQCFVANPMPLLYTQINHIDGDKDNNRADNLEWCDCWLNMQHRKAMRKRLGLPWSTETDKMRQARIRIAERTGRRIEYCGRAYQSINAMARAFGVGRDRIRDRVGKTWRGLPLVAISASCPAPATEDPLN